MTGVRWDMKSKKLTPYFIGPYHITQRVGAIAYKMALPLSLSNLHDIFHVSQFRKYIRDPSHITQIDDVQVRDNMTVDASSIRIEDREVK